MYFNLTLFRPSLLLKRWITSRPIRLWSPNAATFPKKNIRKHFKVVLTCASTLTLTLQPSFDSKWMFIKICFSPIKKSISIRHITSLQLSSFAGIKAKAKASGPFIIESDLYKLCDHGKTFFRNCIPDLVSFFSGINVSSESRSNSVCATEVHR